MRTLQDQDQECPFCAPWADRATFAETPDFRALYNISPILPGHVLIVPKMHVTSLMELDENCLCGFFVFARSVTSFLQGVFHSTGFNWTIQSGEAAGQTVSHLHLHLIPRKSGDLQSPGDWYPAVRQSESVLLDDSKRARLNDKEIAQVVGHLRSEWSRLQSKIS
jgi:bis(5'-adenosyl)-triphosphatase